MVAWNKFSVSVGTNIAVPTLTGRQITMRSRSAVARLAKKVLVGDLKDDFRITVKMIRMLPHTPRQNVKLFYGG